MLGSWRQGNTSLGISLGRQSQLAAVGSRQQSTRMGPGLSSSSLPAPPAQESSPRCGGNVPKGKALGVARWGLTLLGPPGHVSVRCRAGTPLQDEKAAEAGVHRQAPRFATLPYLRDVARRFPGNGDGIPNTSGRVSLPPLRCHPPFPG